MKADEDTWLTVPEAAQVKGVSDSAIYKAISDGRLPSQRVLGRVAVRRSDIYQWEPVPQGGRRQRAQHSVETKARISEGMKKRWQQRLR
jgi:excisionase family DNA binding protein